METLALNQSIAPSSLESDCFREFMAEIYALVSGRAGQRDWLGTEKLYHPNARFVRINDRRQMLGQKFENDGDGADASMCVMNLAEYIKNVSPVFLNYNFQEQETFHVAHSQGASATIQSGYTARLWNDEEDRSWSGINFVHLVKQNDAWRMLNMVWDANFHS